MGIERFFNSLKDDFNITESIKPDSRRIIKSDYLFIDFNSIIHVVSQRINNIVDTIVRQSLLDYNGCGDSNSMEYLKNLNLDDKYKLIDIQLPKLDFSNGDSEQDVLDNCKKYFTVERLDDIIINNVGLFVINLIKKFDTKQLKMVYMSIDGVPSKAKMVEQKKRRFMGEFESNAMKEMVEKYKEDLNVEKSSNCTVPFNKYQYLQNKIVWSRGAISPATSFMLKLSRFLTDIKFKNKINEININLGKENIILSNFTEKDEGEKKIMDYINDNNINGSICIFSPDADLILLSMILKNKRLKKIVLRNDQQKSEKITNTIDSYYDITDINKLEDMIFEYMDNVDLEKARVIDDIVFIFTIFGDDFLHKIESFDVRNDINLILDIYKDFISTSNYILSGEKQKQINYINFKQFLQKLVGEENEVENGLIKRNFMNKKYKNFNWLSSDIMSKTQLKQTDVVDFIKKHNTNYEIKLLENNIQNLISKFITVEVNPLKLLGDVVITNLNVNLVPLNYFLKFLDRAYDSSKPYSNNKFNKDIYAYLIDKSKFTNIKKNIFELVNFVDLNKDLFESSNIQTDFIKSKLKPVNKDSKPNDIIKLLIINFYIFNKISIKEHDIPKINSKFLNLIEREYTFNALPKKRKLGSENNYDKEKILFGNMVDEYYTKLNKNYELPLGNPDLTFEEGKSKFYTDFFKDIDLSLVIKMYIDGLQWVLDYYFNGITYNKWFYMFDKSPLIQDIIMYLDEVDDNSIFENSKEGLVKCCSLSLTEQLTPLEQLIYITPFSKEGKKLKMFYSFSDEFNEKLNKLIGSLINSEEFSSLYPDIKSISKRIINDDTNNDIDCRSAIFLNKCILNVVNDSNLIDETKFRTEFRKQISVEEQNRVYSESIVGGGMNDLFHEYKKYKKLFLKSGKLEFKNKYKRLKHFLLDYV